jgi:hypothetical protein
MTAHHEANFATPDIDCSAIMRTIRIYWFERGICQVFTKFYPKIGDTVGDYCII